MRPFVLAVALALLAAAPARAVVGGGDISFEPKGAGKAVFSHDGHVVRAKLGCRDCHARLYLDTKRSQHATMKQMERGRSCGACHNGKRAFGVDDCTRCHQ
jgi:c(7)-type cytochrome triheme protein